MDPSENFIIKASEDFITPGFNLDLVAVRVYPDHRRECVNVLWSIAPTHVGITIFNGQLKINKIIHNLDYLEITCLEPCSGLSATRSFPVVISNRCGKLVHFIKSDQIYAGDGFRWDLWGV